MPMAAGRLTPALRCPGWEGDHNGMWNTQSTYGELGLFDFVYAEMSKQQAHLHIRNRRSKLDLHQKKSFAEAFRNDLFINLHIVNGMFF